MITVLVVEDEFAIADMLQVELEDAGYRVFTAANGRQALERFAENRPDLVISDFMMPIMNGAELGLGLRGDPRNTTLAIIMMSAVPEGMLRARFTGYDGFLLKPFRIPELLKLVGDVLARSASR